MPASSSTVLLVDIRGDALADEIQQMFPQLEVTVAASDTAARAYLGASEFDVVVVGPTMPEETAASLESLVESLGHPSRVLTGARASGLVTWIGEQLAVTSRVSASSGVEEASGEQQAVLASVSAELSRIAHALNNPLAVIDGNAQLALELAKALGVDASVISAIEDIQGGSQSLARLFADIAALRARVDGIIG